MQETNNNNKGESRPLHGSALVDDHEHHDQDDTASSITRSITNAVAPVKPKMQNRKKRKQKSAGEPHIVFDKQGEPYYRTVSLKDQKRAVSFARCLERNARYQKVHLCEADKGTGWYVRYQPTNRERIEALASIKQNQRYQRALAEKDSWKVTPDRTAEYIDRWHVRTREDEEPYLTGEDFCTCSDFTTRCKKAKLLCKHMIGIALLIGEGVLHNRDTVPKRRG